MESTATPKRWTRRTSRRTWLAALVITALFAVLTVTGSPDAAAQRFFNLAMTCLMAAWLLAAMKRTKPAGAVEKVTGPRSR